VSTLPVIVPNAPAASAHVHPADVIKDISSKDIAGAKVLFINMPLRESAVPNNAPEGPLLLATNLIKNYEVEASIIDLNAYRIQDQEATSRGLSDGRHLNDDEASGLIERHIKAHGEPDVVAFSGKITTHKWQKKVAKMVRKIVPSTFLVSGGGLATELKIGQLNYTPELDATAHSEGDDVIVKIVYDALSIRRHGWQSAIASGKLAPYYIGDLKGKPKLVYAGDSPRNLDALPHADLELLRQDVDGNLVLAWYLGIPEWSTNANNSSAAPWQDEDVVPKTNSVSSRGCKYHCFYCFRETQGGDNWGVRSAEHIVRELLEHKERYDIKFHGFPDDNSAIRPRRFDAIAELLKQHGLNIKWGTHTRLDEMAGLNKSTYETAESMANAGCIYVGFGPESASPKVLEAIGKGGHTLSNGMIEVMVDGRPHLFPKSMVIGIQKAARVGIHGNCTWIIGSPTETLADVQESVRFIQWQKEFYSQFDSKPESVNSRMFTMTWYPGVALINNPKVRKELTDAFNLKFSERQSRTAFRSHWEPVMDENFEKYVEDLDDATKVLYAPESGKPLNFSDMDNDTFLKVRELIDSGKTLDILSL